MSGVVRTKHVFFTAHFWIQVCMAIGPEMMMRLAYKFEEILPSLQSLMKLALHLCRAKPLVPAVCVPLINLLNVCLQHMQNKTVFM